MYAHGPLGLETIACLFVYQVLYVGILVFDHSRRTLNRPHTGYAFMHCIKCVSAMTQAVSLNILPMSVTSHRAGDSTDAPKQLQSALDFTRRIWLHVQHVDVIFKTAVTRLALLYMDSHCCKGVSRRPPGTSGRDQDSIASARARCETISWGMLYLGLSSTDPILRVHIEKEYSIWSPKRRRIMAVLLGQQFGSNISFHIGAILS